MHQLCGAMAVDVGQEMTAHLAEIEFAQRFHREPRAEIGSADAEIDDVGDAAREIDTAVAAAVHGVDERRHAFVRRCDLGEHAARREHLQVRFGCAKRRVQGGALLGAIDRIAAEHRVARLGPL